MAPSAIGLALGLLAALPVAHAGHPRPIERLGRWSGIGWGDGYHACDSSGFRPGADLPPRSHAATYGAKPLFAPDCPANANGQSFYDRFDRHDCDQCGAGDCGGGCGSYVDFAQAFGIDSDEGSESAGIFLAPPVIQNASASDGDAHSILAPTANEWAAGSVAESPVRVVSSTTPAALHQIQLHTARSAEASVAQATRLPAVVHSPSTTTESAPPRTVPRIAQAAKPLVNATTTKTASVATKPLPAPSRTPVPQLPPHIARRPAAPNPIAATSFAQPMPVPLNGYERPDAVIRTNPYIP